VAASGIRVFEAGKLIDGCKRHILEDILGRLMAVVVTFACVHDRDGARMKLKVGLKRKFQNSF
jgi:hypothetical protein